MSTILLLFACAGAQAQDAAANQDGDALTALGLNDAQFVVQSVPASMAPGSVHNVAVTMKNTGSATWPAGGVYRLGAQNPQDNARWGGARAALGAAVAPGGQGTFSFQVTAPATPGAYGFQWCMVQEGVAWFGPLTPNVAVTVAGAAPRNDAQVTAQGVPAQMSAGKSYTVSLTLKNTGTSTWKSADGYVLGAQNPQDNRLWNASGRVALGATVAPGQQYTFSFPVVAPAAGAYSMQWRMLREGDVWFGGISGSPVTVAGAAGADIVTYIHTDALGSPVARSDAAGNVISRTHYEPYGPTAGGVTPTIGFAGHVNDTDTGLVYMQQRYYDPVAGRFLSIDPVVTDANTGGGFNRYVYANNNPYKYIDPDGRNPLIIVPLTGAVIGGGINAVMQYSSTGTVEWGGLGGVIDAAGDGFLLGTMGLMSSSATSVTATATSNIRANNAAGAAFQSKVAAQIKASNIEMAEEVTIKTASGVKTRMDIVTRDANGTIGCKECKSSATAPLTKNQAVAHPQIATTGGVVVGKGKSGFPGGTVIPPTKVDVIRP